MQELQERKKIKKKERKKKKRPENEAEAQAPATAASEAEQAEPGESSDDAAQAQISPTEKQPRPSGNMPLHLPPMLCMHLTSHAKACDFAPSCSTAYQRTRKCHVALITNRSPYTASLNLLLFHHTLQQPCCTAYLCASHTTSFHNPLQHHLRTATRIPCSLICTHLKACFYTSQQTCAH